MRIPFSLKLMVVFITVVLFAGIISSYIVYIENSRILKKQIVQESKTIAFHIIDSIDRFLYERYTDIQMAAVDPIIISRDSTPKQIAERLAEYRNR